jgi:hypothetical protein
LRTIYEAGLRALRVRALVWGAAALALGALYLAVEIYSGAGPASAGGLHLAAPAERIAIALAVAAAGVTALGGMVLFADHYVVAIAIDRARGRVAFETVAVWRRRVRVYAIHALGPAATRAGALHTGKHDVHAPYVLMPAQGRRFPYVIDMQGLIGDADGFRWLLHAAGHGG